MNGGLEQNKQFKQTFSLWQEEANCRILVGLFVLLSMILCCIPFLRPNLQVLSFLQ